MSNRRGINATPYSMHFGRTPPDLSVDKSLPREVVQPLETEDQLEQALDSRQVIEYASLDSATPTALPSPNLIPLSHLSLLESPSEANMIGATAFYLTTGILSNTIFFWQG